MPTAIGDWNYNWGYTTGNTSTLIYSDNTAYPVWQSGSSAISTITYPTYIVPAVQITAPPEPEPDGPLDWLRGQVAEVCELARAA